MTPPGPAPIMPLNLAGPELPQDVISIQAQKLNAVEDDRKLLCARLAQLEATVQDRDRELREAWHPGLRTERDLGGRIPVHVQGLEPVGRHARVA